MDWPFGVTLWLTVLALVGLGINLVLLRRSFGDGGLPGCGVGSACDAVTSSRWSKWAGIPVAGPGAVVYVIVLVAALVAGRGDGSGSSQKAAWFVLASMAVMVGGAAVWFMGLQAMVIKRLCVYCTGLHVVGAVVCGIVLGSIWRGVTPGVHVGFWAAGAGLVAVLIGGQVLIRPKMYRLEVGGDVRGATPEVASQAPPQEEAPPQQDTPSPQPSPGGRGSEEARQEPRPPEVRSPEPGPIVAARKVRKVSLYRGRIVLGAQEWPMMGPGDAGQVVAELFDYTCPDCRQMHRLLGQVRQQYGQRLAILRVPVPLDPACNPAIPRGDRQHANACIYARLALAVWMADPGKFEQYDGWLFDHQVPSVAEAREEAERLIGIRTLREVTANPVLEGRLKQAVGLLQIIRGGKLPMLVLPDAILWGIVPSLGELVKILDEQLAARPALPAATAGGARPMLWGTDQASSFSGSVIPPGGTKFTSR